MTDHPIIVFTALLILGYGVFSRMAERTIITAPMVFVFVGMLASATPIEFLRDGARAPVVKVMAELTLILVLFIDASTIDLKRLIKERNLPIRLLFIGLPITMMIGWLFAEPLFPDQSTLVLLLMALILSPTDAALGQAVVTSKQVPERLRQTINVESGLNDGIALPPILICMALISGGSGEKQDAIYWGGFILKQFVYGPVIGGAVGWAGGKVIEAASAKGWMNHTFQRLGSVSLAILAYSLAEYFHGNGFIAAFFCGLLLGTEDKQIRERIQEFGEADSHALILFIFLLFGMILVPISFPLWDWRAWVYALLSLTIIRILPAVISLWGTDLSLKSRLFIGWFGPRGIASVLYLMMAIIALGPEGHERFVSVVTLTVLLCIFLHGFTAVPFSKLFANEKQ